MDGNSNGSSGDGQISPSTNGNVADFSDVASRTHQKIGDDGVSMKRPFDGSNDSQPEAKKLAADPSIGGTAQRSAQAVAAQINSKFGGNGNDHESSPGNSETINVPDHLVGLLIGKGGEQIASIQAQTDCKIQFAPESGSAERVCTLIGSPVAIQRAKETINGLVEKMQGVGPPPNSSGGHFDDNTGGNSIEMMIPGGKVGLIIGKGGETIKMLQDRAGVKIMVVQDSNQPTHSDKPLRISGDKAACQRAKQMVLDLMAEKDNPMGFQGGNQFGSRSGGKLEIPVPREKVAMIIGKGGDVIRRIQEQSGCRVQFKTDDGGPTRMCTITGDDQCVEIASNIIRDIMENGTRPGSFNRGGGGGPPGGFGGPGSDWGGPMGPPLPGIRGGFGPNGTQYAIPADKCGLVIGKGGENIREINRVSGAHVELNRDSAQDRHERLFRIQGSHDQIQHAIQLIHEKCGIPMPAGGGFMGGPMGPVGGPPMPGPLSGAPMGPNPYGPPTPQGPPMGSQPGMMPPQQPVYGQPWGNPYPQPIPQQQPPQQPLPLPYAQPVQAMPPTGAPGPAPIDPSKQQSGAADPNAAAWAAYYAQYYGQPAAASVAPMAPMQQQQPGPMAYPGVPVASAAAPVAAQPQPTVNQATGQLDYSQAWAEYYRQQGMHQHAAAILANQAASQAGMPHA